MAELKGFTKYFLSEYSKGYEDGRRNKEFDGLSFAYHLGWKDGMASLAETRKKLRDFTEQYFRGGTSLEEPEPNTKRRRGDGILLPHGNLGLLPYEGCGFSRRLKRQNLELLVLSEVKEEN